MEFGKFESPPRLKTAVSSLTVMTMMTMVTMTMKKMTDSTPVEEVEFKNSDELLFIGDEDDKDSIDKESTMTPTMTP
jgi:hypothetical protein